MASIIKKNRHNAGKTARSVADCNFKSDLYRSEPDSETTILCADSNTTILCSDAGDTALTADLGTTVLDSSEDSVKIEDNLFSEPPGTTVLNFADVKDKIPFGVVPDDDEAEDDELEPAPEPQAEASSEPAPMLEEKTEPKVVISVEVRGTGDVFEITKDSTTVGKSKYSDLQIKNTQTVSRTHIILHRKENRLFAEDNNSLNGSFINNKKLLSGETREIFDGDVVRISDEELIVCVKEEA